MHVVIVGGGIYGVSTAWALRRSGHRVSLIERNRVPSRLASSSDRHRLIRYAYGDQLGYMRMVGDAYAAWERVWADLGQRLYVETGTLGLGEAADGWSNRSFAALEGDGHAVEALSRPQLAARFPLLDPVGVEHAFYLKSGGTLLAQRIVAGLARWLRQHGVELHEGVAVTAIDRDAARVTLADGRQLSGDLVLVSAGAWAHELAPELGARAVPSRQVVTYLIPPPGTAQAWARHPMILNIGTGFYLVPSVIAPDGRATGLKIGDHSFSRTGHPERDRDVVKAETLAQLELCRRRLRNFAQYRVEETKTCFYTVTIDDSEEFIARPLGQAAWLLSCCSGHGFKFGAAIGEGFAALIDGRIAPQAFSRWVAGATDVPSPVRR
jgi:glycine/D-amino acid oxidase-like deaminating enzyme